MMRRLCFPALRPGSLLSCACALGVFLCIDPGAGAYPQAGSPSSAVPNLTPVQQQKLTALENASRAQTDQLFGHLRHLRDRLSDLYGAYALDTAEARRLNSELNRVQSQLLDLRLSQQRGMRDILSADQFAQLQASMKQHHGDWDDRAREHGEPSGSPGSPGSPHHPGSE